MGDFMADFGMKNSAFDVSNGTAKDVAKTGDGKKAVSTLYRFDGVKLSRY